MVRLFFVLMLFVPLMASAYIASPVDQPSPFEISTLSDALTEQWLIGELSGFAHTFEFTLTESTPVHFQVMVPVDTPESERVSLVAVKEVERGVTEVMRRPHLGGVWSEVYDPIARLSLLVNEAYEDRLEPGVYRVEVSNPTNVGKYVLQWGSEDTAGYVEQLRSAAVLRSAFGYSPAGVLLGASVLIPLFSIASLTFFGWWFWRRRRVALTE